MTADIEAILRALAAHGPLPYQALPADEQTWRGRYLLMAAAVSRSAAFAWANALAAEGDAADEMRALVAATGDERIAKELELADISVEDLLSYAD